ncbi:MAG: hypothetical protein ABJE47_02865 [bacterium]
MRFVRPTSTLALLASTLVFAGGCTSREAQTDASATTRISLATEHFAVSSYGLDSVAVRRLAAYLEDNQARVVKELRASPMGITSVVVQSKDEFDVMWAPVIKASGIGFQPQALTGPDGAIYIYGPWARQHSGSALGQDALHEFAHAVTRRTALDYIAAAGRDTAGYVFPDSVSKRVRWLSEAIATYEAGQSTDLNRFGYLMRGNYPSIAALNDPANSQIYQIGYRLAEFIVKTWGAEGLARLVQHDANVHAALGISEDELMRRWFLAIEDRYLLIKPRWFTTAR